MAVDYPKLLADLHAESTALSGILYELTGEQWRRPTPAAGWTIHDQVSHLAYFDDAARLALTDAEDFSRRAQNVTARGTNFPDLIAEDLRAMRSGDLMRWFTLSRDGLLSAFEAEDPARRIPWFGPDMSVASSATARLMETWAHGQDVYDALGLTHPPCPGLRSIAHLGVSTFGWSFRVNGLPVPEDPVRVELSSPGGTETWAWGPADAANRVSGPAEDFVLSVTQRRLWTTTAVVADGPVASRWMDLAQAYAGAPGGGRAQQATTS
jgi:uncharacterized protein (TIGR03084 family)